MAYSTNISFHGVARVVVGEVSTLQNERGAWQSMTLSFYDAAGNLVELVQIHCDHGEKLAVEFEYKAEAA